MKRVHNPSPPVASGGTDAQSAPSPRFRLLRDAEAAKLARILTGERPQTIALVLSHLPPRQAGNVLACLGPQLQADVVRRLVDLDQTELETLREVEEALEARLSEHIHIQHRRVAGLSAVAEILEAADGHCAAQILDNLTARDPRLAERLGPEPFEFDELVRMDDATLAAVLGAADGQVVMLALVGAPPELVERFLDCTPEPQAGWMRRKLSHLGPTRLGDVTEARRRIVQRARQLAVQGRVRWPGSRPASSPFAQVLQPAA